jgi:hypothetical protein
MKNIESKSRSNIYVSQTKGVFYKSIESIKTKKLLCCL